MTLGLTVPNADVRTAVGEIDDSRGKDEEGQAGTCSLVLSPAL